MMVCDWAKSQTLLPLQSSEDWLKAAVPPMGRALVHHGPCRSALFVSGLSSGVLLALDS